MLHTLNTLNYKYPNSIRSLNSQWVALFNATHCFSPLASIIHNQLPLLYQVAVDERFIEWKNEEAWTAYANSLGNCNAVIPSTEGLTFHQKMSLKIASGGMVNFFVDRNAIDQLLSVFNETLGNGTKFFNSKYECRIVGKANRSGTNQSVRLMVHNKLDLTKDTFRVAIALTESPSSYYRGITEYSGMNETNNNSFKYIAIRIENCNSEKITGNTVCVNTGISKDVTYSTQTWQLETTEYFHINIGYSSRTGSHCFTRVVSFPVIGDTVGITHNKITVNSRSENTNKYEW